ncbi:MAG TPA: peptidoglycan editing factor PgeF [Solimonas sp.]
MSSVTGVALALAAAWPSPPGVRAWQTLRHGGVSVSPYDQLNLADHCGDDPVAVAENRRRLRAALELPSEPGWLRQVHGVAVAALPAMGTVTADASWTAQPGVVCAVLTADCLPVLFAAVDGSVVAAAHAGWRGLAAGVLEATLAAMPIAPGRVQAWLGAAIGPAAFEVGPEVRAAFVSAQPEAEAAFRPGQGDRWMADIYALARLRLTAAGVAAVHGGNACTMTEARGYYSFRREPRCGRMATLIWRDATADAR